MLPCFFSVDNASFWKLPLLFSRSGLQSRAEPEFALPLLSAKVVVAGGNSSLLCRAALWVLVSGPSDFVTREATAADVGLCGFLDGRWFSLVLTRHCLVRLFAGERGERNLRWLGRWILLYQQKVWGFTGVTQDCLWAHTEFDLPAASFAD